MKKTLIIQVSPGGTASTFLVNALYGLIPSLTNKKIFGFWTRDNWEVSFDDHDIIVLKSHNLYLDNLILKYEDQYNLYFICSERKEKGKFIDEKYKSYNNITLFDYEELNETSTNTIPIIINNIYNKIYNLDILKNVELDIIASINRIHDMNRCYEEIKNKSFDFIDDFYELHGSHRNRN